jgi:hypothetical protein
MPTGSRAQILRIINSKPLFNRAVFYYQASERQENLFFFLSLSAGR